MLYINAAPQQLPAFLPGLSFDLLKRMDPATIRPLLRIWFGQGRWDYARRVDRREEGVAYHAELHALLVSNRGVVLDTRTALGLHPVVQ